MIDWAFIGTLEGRKLVGYVPDPAGSRSGVTVATGTDIGQMTSSTLSHLPADLQKLLLPYVGLTGARAVAALQATPLTITEAQADALDEASFAIAMDRVTRDYDRAVSAGAFAALPDRAQTVIASVGFQYGSIPQRCPRLWRAAVAGDWAGTIRELRHFGDAYQTRHDKEAGYLAPLLAAN
jgi:GH24 family phage-related lysozyme (muramidase)